MMSANETTNHSHDRSPDEAAMARLYRAAATEQPSPALDARIRATAHEAINKSGARSRTIRRWAVPLSIAATIVLSVSVVVQMSQRGVFDKEDIGPDVASAPGAVATPPAAAEPRPSASVAGDAKSESKGRLAETQVSKLAQARREPALTQERDDSSARDLLKKESSKSNESTVAAAAATPAEARLHADVTGVRVSGAPGAYYFSVAVRSPDTGCGRYADWWEVIGADGKLLYRRVLLHSHAGEQPFERSGGPVPIRPETTVWVRAHMNTAGYGGAALMGSVKTGFAASTPPSGFAASAASQSPLPDGCAF